MTAKQLWLDFWACLTNPVAALYAVATLLLLIGIYKLTAPPSQEQPDSVRS